MNAELLLKHFEQISDVPNAVPRLRRFVLDLAVRGKLVGQNAGDEPATELIRRIRAKSARLAEEGRGGNRKATPMFEDVKEPFGVPANWVWVRFGAVAGFSAGRTPSRHDLTFWNTGEYSWVSIADMTDGGLVIATKETVSEKAKTRIFGSEPVPIGTMIMSFKLTIGKVSRLGVPAFHNEAIISIHPHLPEMQNYLFKVLPQFARKGDTKDAIKGATLNRDSITNICIPLPPLAEQHRIVAKVDELMALCDRLEAAQREQMSLRDRLAATTHHHLRNGEDADARHSHAQFFISHLPRLTINPEQIKQLRQTILDLLVHGQLVTQDPYDEPASSLLQRIQEEQKDLMRRRTIKAKLLNESKIQNDSLTSLPDSWEWTTLAKLLVFGPQNGISPSASSRPDAPKAITLTATTSGVFKSDYFKRIDAKFSSESEFWLRRGDLLFQRGNTREYVGMAAYFDGEDGQFLYPDLIIKVRVSKFVDLRFVHLCSTAPYARAYFEKHATGAQSTMPKINHEILLNLPIPVPPMAEQNRIVAKVDELMALCDRLEEQLKEADAKSRGLLESVLHSALIDANPIPMVSKVIN
jgi:type I restriction enzyme S subunit